MTEKNVKDVLDFLCERYRMMYTYAEFEHYLGTNACIETYNYHNKYGCFTISNVAVRGEIDFYHLNSIDQLKDFLCSTPPEFRKLTPENEEKYREYADSFSKCNVRIFV